MDGNQRLDACNKRSVHDTINVRCPSQAHTVFSRNPETASERGNGVCDRSPCMWRRFSTSSAPVRCRIPPRPTATPGLPRGIGARDGGVSVVVGCLAAAKGRIRRPRQRHRVPATAAVDAVRERCVGQAPGSPILKASSPHAVQPRGPARNPCLRSPSRSKRSSRGRSPGVAPPRPQVCRRAYAHSQGRHTTKVRPCRLPFRKLFPMPSFRANRTRPGGAAPR